MIYATREKLAYSWFGKFAANVYRDLFAHQLRVHWIQQAWADGRWV